MEWNWLKIMHFARILHIQTMLGFLITLFFVQCFRELPNERKLFMVQENIKVKAQGRVLSSSHVWGKKKPLSSLGLVECCLSLLLLALLSITERKADVKCRRLERAGNWYHLLICSYLDGLMFTGWPEACNWHDLAYLIPGRSRNTALQRHYHFLPQLQTAWLYKYLFLPWTLSTMAKMVF